MKILAAALKKSDIMNLNLSLCIIQSEAIQYLSHILSDTKLLSIDLSHVPIGNYGAIDLAYGLPNSQVIDINLDDNDIEYEGYKALINVVDKTNVSSVSLRNNKLEEGMSGERCPHNISRNTIPRSTTTIANEIEKSFRDLVEFNLESNEYEFIRPARQNIFYSSIDIDQYVFLIDILKHSPNTKVHIFKMVNEQYKYDFDFVKMMKKIDEFIADILNRFNFFFESILTDEYFTFSDIDYINLVKVFEELKLYDIVFVLLLHRVLYYVDENFEILHPYIYKLMYKHGLPIYQGQLEPNKRDKIISYYESHQEIDGVQEIIDLLKLSSL